MAGLRVDGVIGRLGAQPELRLTPSGAAVASVSIVFQESYKDNNTGQWVDKDPVWVNATGWRELAESMAQGLNKGDEVMVSGVLSLRTYDKRDGGQGTSLDLNVSQIGPTMRRQQVQVRRITREQGDGPAAGASDDPWSQPPQGTQQARPAAGQQQRGYARQGQWSNGEPVAQGRQGGFDDDPPPFHHSPAMDRFLP